MPGPTRHRHQQMKVTLTNVSKSFGREVVINDLTHTFAAGSRTAVLGPNGSGKSTLLQVAAGALVPTAGTVSYTLNETSLRADDVYRHLSIAAPYLNLYEDLDLGTAIRTHAGFKPLRAGVDPQGLAHIAYLDAHWNKPVRNLSSGMRQRLKLALAILSDTPLLLLDEPASNLDAAGTTWFRDLLMQHLDRRTLLVASNRQQEETFACDQEVGTALRAD